MQRWIFILVGILSFASVCIAQAISSPAPTTRLMQDAGWSKAVDGLQARIKIEGADAPYIWMSVTTEFFNSSEHSLAFNAGEKSLWTWEVRDAAGKIVDPRENNPPLKNDARVEWAAGGFLLGTEAISKQPNTGGRLELDGRVWQLQPGKYTLQGTFGRVEMPACAFEIFKELSAKEFTAEVERVRSKPFNNAGEKWRALAELVKPGMDIERLHEALPSSDGFMTIMSMGGAMFTVYSLDARYAVEATIKDRNGGGLFGRREPEKLMLADAPEIRLTEQDKATTRSTH